MFRRRQCLVRFRIWRKSWAFSFLNACRVPSDRIETVLAAAIEHDRKTRIREEELRSGARYED